MRRYDELRAKLFLTRVTLLTPQRTFVSHTVHYIAYEIKDTYKRGKNDWNHWK